MEVRMVITLDDDGKVIIYGGKKNVVDNVQPRESFTVSAGDYTVTIRRKDGPKRKIIKLR